MLIISQQYAHYCGSVLNVIIELHYQPSCSAFRLPYANCMYGDEIASGNVESENAKSSQLILGTTF